MGRDMEKKKRPNLRWTAADYEKNDIGQPTLEKKKSLIKSSVINEK